MDAQRTLDDSHEALRQHAQRVRASGVLGRSKTAERVFAYLIDRSISGSTPKEIEIAVDALGREATFDVTQDSIVRVHIHKLRRKLEEFYAGSGRGEPMRLVMPKGGYRFTLVSAAEAPVVEVQPIARFTVAKRRGWMAAMLAAVVLVSGMAGAVLMDRVSRSQDPLIAVREHPIWQGLFQDQRPIYVVVGDYYIFGESDPAGEVQRLVREFDVNSQQDLERYLQMHPEFENRYLDLQLAYLPTASASALSDVMPLLGKASARTRVVTMSELSPAILKSAHVIYVGYVSGLGRLESLVFAGSRFAVGASYDELVDSKTQQRYVSEVPNWLRDFKYHDYGYFSTFRGPNGNEIIVIAGTRDLALTQMAEALTSTSGLSELAARAGPATSFEALYEVYGMDRLNLDGKLLVTSALNTAAIWKDAPR